MKKIIAILVISSLVISCSNKKDMNSPVKEKIRYDIEVLKKDSSVIIVPVN